MKPTTAQVIEKVKQLAAERPENMYRGVCGACCYDEGTCTDGSVGCIFGQAFVALGVTEFPSTGKIRDVLPKIVSDVPSEDQIDWCRDVQLSQDRQFTWGESVKEAELAAI